MFFRIIFLVFISNFSTLANDCPCQDRELCRPVQRQVEYEKLAFMVSSNNWKYYDYSQLTSIVICTEQIDPELVCLAHSNKVRLIWIANFDVQSLSNKTARSLWIDQQIDKVKQTFTDGINFDVEDEIQDKSAAVQQYTELVQDLTNRLHDQIPGSKVSVDVAWSAPCIDGRCYDYSALANVSDFLFVMAYDLRSQIYDLNDCIASANAPIDRVAAGLTNFTEVFQISPKKLVLGVPWYCYDYRCLSIEKNLTCLIEHVPFRGAPCSDAAGTQHDYRICRDLLRFNSTTARLIDPKTGGIFFNYINNEDKSLHQIWMDDPESLTIKYELARTRNLFGIGMWDVDSLDFSPNATSFARQDTEDMWNAMKI